jgi:hypothetical protein
MPTREELYPLSLAKISNRTTADCILLGYDAAPLGTWLTTFQRNMVILSSNVQRSKKNLLLLLRLLRC